MVDGVVQSGVISMLANNILHATGKSLPITSITILWISSVFSSIIDNIPYMATLIPIIKQMIPEIAQHNQLLLLAVAYPLWWTLSLGGCLGVLAISMNLFLKLRFFVIFLGKRLF